jgi:hypothetical protein
LTRKEWSDGLAISIEAEDSTPSRFYALGLASLALLGLLIRSDVPPGGAIFAVGGNIRRDKVVRSGGMPLQL